MLKLGRDERFDVLTADAARGGGHALADKVRDQERPVVRGMPGSSAGQVRRLQVETPGR
jgi:hypothetical protein